MAMEAKNTNLVGDHCAEYETYSRRSFLKGGGRSLAALLFGQAAADLPGWAPRIALADPSTGPRGDTLVCVFLRGGADGLNMIVPFGDEDYYRLRPTLAIGRPDQASAEARAIDLNGFFGLHPSLGPLDELYRAGDMAFVQAVGSPHGSRSHFEAMAFVERGATAPGGDYSGWIARHLLSYDTQNESPLRAVAISDQLPASLGGAQPAVAVPSIEGYSLQSESGPVLQSVLGQLYHGDDSLLRVAAEQTLAAIDILRQINPASYQPRGRAYGESQFAAGLLATAQLIRAEVGVEVACVDLGGWDTHALQGAAEGTQPTLMAQLSEALAAFYEDLQDQMGSVTVVIMSEFGRRARENAARGTDHGYGNMMMLMGGGVRGAQVFSRWPGLSEEGLAGPGDLEISTDYRDVLGELLTRRLNNPALDLVFPGWALTPPSLFDPRT